jgi:hypothetical protein
MDILKGTIDLLNKEEIINYKLYANRTQSNENRKDILLFDLLKKHSPDTDDTKVVQKLYPGTKTKNSYYRLKNRLLNEINNSLVQFYCYDTNSHDIYSELSLYKVFHKKNNWPLANYHLLRAEKKAMLIQDFSLLDVIYTEQINLSIQFGETTPAIFIKKREQNQQKLNEIRALDDSLATIIYELKRSQNFSKTKNHTSQILNKAIIQLNSKKEYRNNLIFKTKLFNAISRLLLSKQDYISLEKYTLDTYHEFIKQHYFSRINHEIKLQMLAYISNTLFVNKKHSQSLEYLKLLHDAMKEYKSMHYNNYVFFYYNSLVNNYTVINPDKAIEVLNAAKENKVITTHPTHLGYIYLNLAGAYFDLKQHKIALKNIIKLYNHKLFNTIDNSFKIKIHITEIILRVETQDYDYADKLLTGTIKANKSLLSNKEYKQELDFMQLLTELIRKHDFEKNKYSKTLITSFCNRSYPNSSSSIVNYKKWLEEKFNLSA